MLLQLTNMSFLNAFKRNQPAIPGFHWCPNTSAKRKYTTPTENSVPGLESITICTLRWRDKVEFHPTLSQASQNQENSLPTLDNATIARVCTDRRMKLAPKAQKRRNRIAIAYVCSSLKDDVWAHDQLPASSYNTLIHKRATHAFPQVPPKPNFIVILNALTFDTNPNRSLWIGSLHVQRFCN